MSTRGSDRYPAAGSSLEASPLRAQFPGLARRVHGKPLIYFDNANTAQKPQVVIDAVSDYYHRYSANVARAVHTLGEEATVAYEGTRDAVASLLGVADRNEVVLTRGTTESLNLVAWSWLRPCLRAGDVVLVSHMEHHANIVPWQLLAAEVGASVQPIPITDAGELDLDALRALLSPAVKLLGLTHASNALGTINPVAEVCALARQHGIITVIDGSQAAPHLKLDLPSLGCDFYAFTGHKLFGPTGTGALWGRAELLQQMVPFMGGGEMIRTVSFEGTRYADPPQRFEAGTPNIAGHIGLRAAIAWVQQLGFEAIAEQEQKLAAAMLETLRGIEGLRLIGEARERLPVFSFVVNGAHAHDLALLLDQDGIALRSGQHCAHPLMQRFGVAATLRASLSVYNTLEEVTQFGHALARAVRLLRG